MNECTHSSYTAYLLYLLPSSGLVVSQKNYTVLSPYVVIRPSLHQHIPNPPGPTQWAHSQFSNNVYMYRAVPSSASFVNHLPSPVQKIRRYCTLGHNIITLVCRLSFLMHLHPGKGGRTGVEDVREHEMTESASQVQPYP